MNNQRDDFFKRNQAAQIAAMQMQDVQVARSIRKPLTEDQIMLLANETSTQYWGTEAHILRLARAIERAHGIGK